MAEIKIQNQAIVRAVNSNVNSAIGRALLKVDHDNDMCLPYADRHEVRVALGADRSLIANRLVNFAIENFDAAVVRFSPPAPGAGGICIRQPE